MLAMYEKHSYVTCRSIFKMQRKGYCSLFHANPSTEVEIYQTDYEAMSMKQMCVNTV